MLWNKEKKMERYSAITGSANWNWKGGLPKCKTCGITISYGKKHCKKCHGLQRRGKFTKSLIPYDKIVELYLLGKSTIKISQIAGISPTYVWIILRNKGVRIRTMEEREKLKRKYDYNAIAGDYKNGMYLRDISKKYNINPSTAGHIIEKSGIKRRGREINPRGSDHSMWKGGKTHDKVGYIILKEGKEHRVIVEKIIGRRLFHWEQVHHIDANKQNNNPENLAIIPSKEHSRFHTLLRQAGLLINESNFKEICRQESKMVWRFTFEDLERVKEKLNLTFVGLNKKGRGKCKRKDCDGIRAGAGFCTKHYQRWRARKRGYWIRGGGHKSPFIGKQLRN
ncbi:MAG: HNH endonuclease [Patescibacteria group bacterium]|nr:HNH endonuclease [Patescibacteria group bacterium]